MASNTQYFITFFYYNLLFFMILPKTISKCQARREIRREKKTGEENKWIF